LRIARYVNLVTELSPVAAAQK